MTDWTQMAITLQRIWLVERNQIETLQSGYYWSSKSIGHPSPCRLLVVNIYWPWYSLCRTKHSHKTTAPPHSLQSWMSCSRSLSSPSASLLSAAVWWRCPSSPRSCRLSCWLSLSTARMWRNCPVARPPPRPAACPALSRTWTVTCMSGVCCSG